MHVIDFAVRSDGSEPAAEMLGQLSMGEWRQDTDHDPAAGWPDDRQPDDRYKLVQVIRVFAETGTAHRKNHIGNLENGIWEFKVRAKRLSFYDTDGRGTSFERPKIRNPADSARGAEDACWHVPAFMRAVRVGHGFPKSGQLTDPSDVQMSKKVRDEDLAYDRAA